MIKLTDKAFKIYNRVRLVALVILVLIAVWVVNRADTTSVKNTAEVSTDEVISTEQP